MSANPRTCGLPAMTLENAPFYYEIEALGEHFQHWSRKYKSKWLEKGWIHVEAVYALWDIMYRTQHNLIMNHISLEALTPAMAVAEDMVTLAHRIDSQHTQSDNGVVFAGTPEEYDAAGTTLLDSVSVLETWAEHCKDELLKMATDQGYE